MKYSNTILTDDNFDEEIEKLASVIGIPFVNYEGFVDTLTPSYKCQIHEKGFEEWAMCVTCPSVGTAEAYQKGYLAYEFGNGFVIFNFEVLL